MLIATYNINGQQYPKSWRIGMPLEHKFPDQICEIQVDGDELDYVLQFVPHEKITLKVVKFYGFDAYKIVCGINEDYYKHEKVVRYV